MKISVISFSKRGKETGQAVANALKDHEVKLFTKSEYTENAKEIQVGCPIGKWAGEQFDKNDALIFVGALGIAVRAIAPYIKSKKTDPAVIVLDEKATFVISLLSGHLGGANELATIIANKLGGTPVITTATDINHKFAVDVFAKKNGCYISDMTLAKEVSAAIVNGDRIPLVSDFPVNGKIPEELDLTVNEEALKETDSELNEEILKVADFNSNEEVLKEGDFASNERIPKETDSEPMGELKIRITLTPEKWNNEKKTLFLIPKIITAGIGCKKNTEKDIIKEQFKKACEREKLSPYAIEKIASIDLKKDEEGLIGLGKEMAIPFITFTKEELEKVPGDFTESDFVKQITGVSNVCERSAIAGSDGKIVMKKFAENGVTVAFAVKKWSVNFE